MSLGIGSAVAAFNIFMSGQKAIVDGQNSKEVMRAIVEEMQNQKLGLVRTSGSITKLVSPFVIEPVIIATDSSRNVEVFDKALQLSTDVFASFYLQAFKILTNFHGLGVQQSLALLTTDNSSLSRVGVDALSKYLSREEHASESYLRAVLSQEDHYLRLSEEAGWFTNLVGNAKKAMGIGNNKQQVKGVNPTVVDSVDPKAKEEEKPKLPTAYTKSSMKDMDNDPLYGTLIREIEVQFTSTDTKQSVVFPITIKSHVIITSINNIINMLSPNANDKKFVNRLDEWRAGAISFWDLVACGDLIHEYKNNKLKDKENILNIVNERVRGSASTAMSGVVKGGAGIEGYEKNYNLLVVTEEDKIRLDKHVNGDIIKERYKQELLEQAHSMMCIVLNQDYERANLLIKDIRGISDIGFKALGKRKEKGNDELSGIFQSLLTNKPIGF